MSEKDKSGQEPREVVSGNRLFLIYDGQGGNGDALAHTDDARKKFVDRVMDEIGQSETFQVIDGNLTGEIIKNPNEKTVIEFAVPKNPAGIDVIKKQPEQDSKEWNIRYIFRRGH